MPQLHQQPDRRPWPPAAAQAMEAAAAEENSAQPTISRPLPKSTTTMGGSSFSRPKNTVDEAATTGARPHSHMPRMEPG